MEEQKRWSIFGGGIFVVLLGVFGVFHSASAASLYLAPSLGTYSIGQAFSVGVYASSKDQATNAISGTITYPTDLLEVTSVSTSGTVISLWVQQPNFSNASATVRFEGIVLNPGYTGSSGKIIGVNFKTKAEGSAVVKFTTGAMLANDGQGTNILSGLGSATYTIGAGAPTTPAPPAALGTPAASVIASSTHPDQNAWYNKNDVTFSWALPSGITGVNVLADHNPTSNPGTTSEGIFLTQTYEDVEDGIWYFHIRLRNSVGWGATAHYRFQIDTKPPDHVTATIVPTDDPTNPRAKFSVDAEDTGSGIDSYEIRIDNGEPIIWKDEKKTKILESPLLLAGDHKLSFRAIDYAGNSLEAPPVFFTIARPVAPGSTQAVTEIIIPFLAWVVIIIQFILNLILILAILHLMQRTRRLLSKVSSPTKNLQRKTREISEVLHREFDALRDDVQARLARLERVRSKRALTSEEAQILKQLHSDFDHAEERIRKAVKALEQAS